MRHIPAFMILFAVLWTSPAFAAEAMKDGFYDETDSKGVLVRTVEYEQGIPNGRFRSFYPDGRIREIGLNVNGRPNGMIMEYYPDGKPRMKTFYHEGVLHGMRTLYYPTGRILSEEPFINGLRDGMVREYSQEGFLCWERPYRNDKQDGIVRQYSPEGILFREYDYKNGVQKGMIREYYPLGAVKGVYTGSGDKRNGPGKEYYTSGELLREGVYADDLLIGQVTEYCKNGHPRSRANYTRGVIDDAAYREYYPSGAVHWLVPIINGQKQGLGKEYYENGPLETEGVFKDDKRVGIFKVYDAAGAVAAEEKYEGGLRQRRTEFFPSGKVKSDKYYFGP